MANTNNIYTGYYDIKNFVDQSNNYTVSPIFLVELSSKQYRCLLLININKSASVRTIPIKLALTKKKSVQ